VALRLVMMGTGNFALPTLRGLYGTQHEIVGLFTQPDRTGRGHHHHRNPLKEAGLEHHTPLFQPQDVNTPESLDELRRLNADLCVVAAYGQILSADLLRVPKLGAVNVHASLLPKYRGAAPVQHAILKGETETGLTIFQIEPKLDAGPILGIETTKIGPKETSGELEHRLAELAAPLMLQIVDQLEAGTVDHISQDPQQVTRAPRLRKSSGAVDWTKPADAIGRHVRAMQPWPSAFTFLEQAGKKPLRLILLDVEPGGLSENVEPGTVISADQDRLIVQTGKGSIEILQFLPEGKRAILAAEFMHGHAVQVGDRLIPSPASGA